MVAVAFALVWAGYSTSLWGWCLLRDYDLTFGQLVSPVHPYSGAWPPAKIPSGQIWPAGSTTTTTQHAAQAAPSGAQSTANKLVQIEKDIERITGVPIPGVP